MPGAPPRTFELAVLAAHPDDEAIGAASLLCSGRRAAVLHLTDGAPRDPRWRPALPGDRAAAAAVRSAEAAAALAEAGLGEGARFALGGVDQEAQRAVPALARALRAWLALARPRVLVTHPLEGGHPDHDAAAVVARAACALLRRDGRTAPRLAEMASYHRDPGSGALVAGDFLPGSGRPAGAAARVLSHRLGPAERAAKLRMLACHRSQRDVLAWLPVALDVERFRWASPVTLAQPPHPGTLHYEALGLETWARWRADVAEGLAALGVLGEATGPGLPHPPGVLG